MKGIILPIDPPQSCIQCQAYIGFNRLLNCKEPATGAYQSGEGTRSKNCPIQTIDTEEDE